MSTNNWFVDRFLDTLGNMPPEPVFKRFCEKPPTSTPSIATSPATAPITIPVPPSEPEPEPAAPSISSLDCGPSWVSVKGKHKKATQHQDRSTEKRDIEEPDRNAELCEKINGGDYHRRDKHDPAGETASTLKQFHNGTIRLYCRPPTGTDPRSWVSCSEIPTTNEILDITEPWQKCDPEDNTVIMRGNKLIGSWESKDAYLGAHFEMLREDVSRPLREAVTWVKNFPDAGEGSEEGSNIGIYSKGTLIRASLIAMIDY